MEQEKDLREKSRLLAETVATILEAKNGQNIEIINVEGKTSLADYFVIASGNSTTHVKTLADEVTFELKERAEILPAKTEGIENRRWILLDYGDLIVHIFHQEERDYYDLERLWAATGGILDSGRKDS